MKQVEVTFKSPSGNEVVKRLNTCYSANSAVETLRKKFHFWTFQSFKVIKEW